MLVHLPAGRTAEAVRDQLVATIATLTTHLYGSLTRDQGAEMAAHDGATPTSGGARQPLRMRFGLLGREPCAGIGRPWTYRRGVLRTRTPLPVSNRRSTPADRNQALRIAIDLVGTIGRQVLDGLLLDRRCRTTPRVVERAMSEYAPHPASG